MNARKIIENPIIKNSEIAKIIGVSGSTVITDKLNGKKYNKITDKNKQDIQEFFYHFLKDAECFNIWELSKIFDIISSYGDLDGMATKAIKEYEEKYMKLGLMDLFL